MLRHIAALLMSFCTLIPAAAQDAKDFPSRAIRIIVPFPAGGPADVTARIIAQKMSEDWSQPVVVENRAAATPSSERKSSPRLRPTATRC